MGVANGMLDGGTPDVGVLLHVADDEEFSDEESGDAFCELLFTL